MSFKTAAILVGATFLFGWASAAVEKSTEQHFSGEVRSIDATTKTLMVKAQVGKKEEMTFSVASDAKIMQSGSAKTLSQVKVGEHVRVAYTTEGSRHEARRIDLFAPRVAKAKPPSGAAAQSKAKANY